jgi:hypothetical protein
MNIVYLVFGNNRDHYRQAYFSICTALAWKNDHDKIIILTEDPSLFNFFGNIAEIIPIDKNIIKEWEGKYQFFWRVKIKALQHIAEKYPLDSILYLDGDTFFYKDMQPIRDGLQNGQNYMHIEEGKLAELSSKTEKLMWKQMQGKTYGNIEIDKKVAMWNAGLVGVSNKHLDCLQTTLEINDAMCGGGVTRRLIEQFAFSLGLNQCSKLQPADHIVGHYWGNKPEWNRMINNFLEECFMKNYPMIEIIEQVKQMDLSQYAIWVKESSTRRKLNKIIDKLFKNTKAVYLGK